VLEGRGGLGDMIPIGLYQTNWGEPAGKRIDALKLY
jgi:hypothetical protein